MIKTIRYPVGAQYRKSIGEGNLKGMAEELIKAATTIPWTMISRHTKGPLFLRSMTNKYSRNMKAVSNFIEENPGCNSKDILRRAFPPDAIISGKSVMRALHKLKVIGVVKTKGVSGKYKYYYEESDDGRSEDGQAGEDLY